MKYNLKVYSIWEFGQRTDSQGNPHQEDSLYPAFGKQTDSDRLFILCDGMGGHDAGEVASATVCEAMSRSILNDGHDKDGVFTEQDFETALSKAFDALDAKDTGSEKKMGTTLTFLKLHNAGATIAHIGDSRVYHIRPGKDGEETQILFQTEDHSLINNLIKVGELTKEEARNSNQKNVITRAMQPNLDRRPKADVYTTTDIQPGDYFYLCSDGMLEKDDMEEGDSLRNIFSQLGGDDLQKVEILKSVTEDNKDNHTAFIIHILDVIDPIVATPSQSAHNSDLGRFAAIVEDSDEVFDEPDLIEESYERPRKKKKSGLTTLLCVIFAALIGVGAMYVINRFHSNTNKEQGQEMPVGSGDSKDDEPYQESETGIPTPISPSKTATPANNNQKPGNTPINREDLQKIKQEVQSVITEQDNSTAPDIAPNQPGKTDAREDANNQQTGTTPSNPATTPDKATPDKSKPANPDKGNGTNKDDKVNIDQLNKLNQKTKQEDADVAKSDEQQAAEQKDKKKIK